MIKRTTTARRLVRGAGLAGALALALTACGGGDDGGSGGGSSPDDVQAALEEGGEITVWAWEPTLEQVVEDFEAENPNVKVNLVNAGTANDQYTALQNAIQAGSGVPDVAQIEYYALGQFAIAESVADLSSFGATELEDTYSPGPWNAVHAGSDGIYGLPMDSGPMALFYNKAVFDRLGVEVPTTWDEYVQAARDLHEADPDVYIGSDTGDAGSTTSLIWQAGGKPYTVDGTNVSIDFSDEGSTTYAETWQQLIDEGLVSDVAGWTDEWYQGLGDGTIATLATGAWMPANFESGVPNASGDWRVAPLPQWEEGGTASAENGGSSLAVPEASGKKELAYAFIEYANAGDGVQTRLENGAFPATTADLNSEEFLNTEFEYFGGQKANEIFAESAANVVEGWSYLPYQVYANSIFNDTVGQAYVSDTTLVEGLAAWQERSIAYGAEQGFTVNE
ncbi:ABC transporter substrate-binding protein [Streptomyces litchfieldiae]|uniref:Sugar ABC transporter substrate-binding protein n=1 Tax=Streptomyces litchfieldiae TaxID=3075543 RepID=A0ABU2MUL3_9ACTN|nr:sugar ABC transporter substrate-binding protein [Streptomyces sp. DSM 44938]MDT0345333.1 sugar ABC transporter substrate-binding protein [Streptomyces sp. DSM 44938]